MYALPLPSMHVICPTQLILFDMITQIIVRSIEHKAPHCVVLHSPVPWSFLGPNIFFSNLILEHTQLLFLSQCETQASHPCRTTGEIAVYIFKKHSGRQKILHQMIASNT
jgi:hypothetical protein